MRKIKKEKKEKKPAQLLLCKFWMLLLFRKEYKKIMEHFFSSFLSKILRKIESISFNNFIINTSFIEYEEKNKNRMHLFFHILFCILHIF